MKQNNTHSPIRSFYRSHTFLFFLFLLIAGTIGFFLHYNGAAPIADTVSDDSLSAVIPSTSANVSSAEMNTTPADGPTTRYVYLTFDDGPSVNTPQVLDVLDQYSVKATFFVTNVYPQYSGYIRTAFEKGHTIGLHTMSHDYASIYASADAYMKDLEEIGQLVKQQIGFVPCFVRFPGGSSNRISSKYCSGVMTELSQELESEGYQYYDWNADSQDGSGHLSAEQIYQNAIKTAGSPDNIVILCHDAHDKESTIQALPRIIQYYRDNGYVFRAISRDSYVPHHTIYN